MIDELEINPVSTTARDLQLAYLGEIISLPTVSYDMMEGGSLESIKSTQKGIQITVRSRGDGTLSKHILAPDDEVVVYPGSRAKQDAMSLPPVITQVLAKVLTFDEIEQWFTKPNRNLRGKSPQTAMRAGQYQQVMAAAQTFISQ